MLKGTIFNLLFDDNYDEEQIIYFSKYKNKTINIIDFLEKKSKELNVSKNFSFIKTTTRLYIDFLRENIDQLELGYNKNFELINSRVAIKIIDKVFDDNQVDYYDLQPYIFLRYIKYIKTGDNIMFFNSMFDSSDAERITGYKHEEIIKHLDRNAHLNKKNFEDYEYFKQKNNLIDEYDLIYYTEMLLRKRTQILSILREKINYLLIDEIYSFSPREYDIFSMLILSGIQIFLTKDDNSQFKMFRENDESYKRLNYLFNSYDNIDVKTIDSDIQSPVTIKKEFNSIEDEVDYVNHKINLYIEEKNIKLNQIAIFYNDKVSQGKQRYDLLRFKVNKHINFHDIKNYVTEDFIVLIDLALKFQNEKSYLLTYYLSRLALRNLNEYEHVLEKMEILNCNIETAIRSIQEDQNSKYRHNFYYFDNIKNLTRWIYEQFNDKNFDFTDFFNNYIEKYFNFKFDGVYKYDEKIWIIKSLRSFKNHLIKERNKFNSVIETFEMFSKESMDLVFKLNTNEDSIFASDISNIPENNFEMVFILGLEDGSFPDFRCLNDDARMHYDSKIFEKLANKAIRSLYLTYSTKGVVYGVYNFFRPSIFWKKS